MTLAITVNSPVQGLAVSFVLLFVAVASIQLLRVAWWAVGGTPSSEGAARLSSRAALVALSTRGLARAAVWLTCAAGAVGLSNALIVIENSTAPLLLILVRHHLEVFEASAVGFALCALLFSASIAVDLIAARIRRRGTTLPAHEAAGETPLLALLRRSPGLIALLLVSYLLLDTRPASVAVSPTDRWFTLATFEMLSRFWLRLAGLLAFVGALTWLITLLESAILRRRLPR